MQSVWPLLFVSAIAPALGCAAAPLEEPPAPLTKPERPPICAPESPQLCVQDGIDLYQGVRAKADPVAAASKFELACLGGDQRGCTWLGIVLAELGNDALGHSRAIDLWADACDAGITMACAQLGSRLLNFGWTSPDTASADAVAIFNAANDGLLRACTTPESQDIRDHWGITVRGYACGNLAASYEHGFAVEKDLGKALALASEACSLGWAPGCTRAAHFLEEGMGIASPDGPAAFDMYRRACDLGDREACAQSVRSSAPARE